VKALILVGGRGKRLGALTGSLPKPMLPVHGRPFLEYVLRELKRSGFSEVVLLCGYRAKRVRDYFGDGARWGLKLHYSVEKKPMGTGGALRAAERWLDPDRSFLLLNGDTYLKTDFRRPIRFHARRRADLTILLARIRSRKAAERHYGSVLLDRNRKVVGFAEKAPVGREAYVNAGVYVIHPRMLRRIPKNRSSSLEREFFPKLVGGRFYGWPVIADFMDIGTVVRYREATMILKPLTSRHD
jgi:NDP-sugar pyrophosphorylase family protein